MSASGGAGTGEGKAQQKHHTRGVAENKQKGRGSGAEEKTDRKAKPLKTMRPRQHAKDTPKRALHQNNQVAAEASAEETSHGQLTEIQAKLTATRQSHRIIRQIRTLWSVKGALDILKMV